MSPDTVRPWDEKATVKTTGRRAGSPGGPARRRRRWPWVVAALAVVVVAAVVGILVARSTTSNNQGVTSPPTTVPGAGTPPPSVPPVSAPPVVAPPLLATAAPAGAVTIGTGDDPQQAVDAHRGGTAFVIASGVHAGFSVTPRSGDQFFAQPGAVLDGQSTTDTAFRATGGARALADDVTIVGASAADPLVVRNYADGHVQQTGTIQTASAGRKATGKQFASGWKLQYVEITGSYARALTLSDGIVVQYCQIVDNQRLGIGGGGQGITLYHDTVSHNGVGSTRHGFEAGGIKTTGHRVLIADNQVDDNGAPGIWTDVNATGVRIADNVITRNQLGVHIEISHSVVISGNRIANNAKKAVLISASDHVLVTGNVIVDNHGGVVAGGVMRGHKSGPHPLTDVTVVGNTIVNSKTSGVAQKLPPGWTVTFDYNTFQGGDFVWNGHQVTFGQWQQEGQERHGRNLG